MTKENPELSNEKKFSIADVIRRFFRIAKLRFLNNYQNCELCGKFTNKIYSIPYIEAGLLVCEKCHEEELNDV
jgi:hypothetical protein